MKNLKTWLVVLGLAAIGAVTGAAITINLNANGDIRIENATIQLAEDQVPAIIEGDQGELIETTEIDGLEIPTVEELDGGGMFEDEFTGVSAAENSDVYYELGAIESVDTSSVENFKNSVLGHCIIANNYYGAQCVSLARAFWWNYADFDVSTCGTGLAKGMMNCAEQNAGDAFKVIWDLSEVQAGTWVVTDGPYTGHICMALGPAANGYVACLGENQGGASCGAGVGGSAANVINLNMKNFIGGYTPLDYIEPEPAPEPEPEPGIDTCSVINVVAGDTMGEIMKRCEGKTQWGAAMDLYADTWISEKTGLSVFYGWSHGSGVGLLAGDTIRKVAR